MMNLQPGMILLFKATGLNFWERIITAEEGDTDICHAAIVGKDGMLWTTGAKDVAFYGQAPLDKYLEGKVYVAVETVEPLSEAQLEIILSRCRSFQGQRYGIEKVLMLILKAKFGGVVSKLHFKPQLPKDVKSPFCSEAVSAAYWEAGIKVCAYYGKLEPSAITPANLFNEASRGQILKIAV